METIALDVWYPYPSTDRSIGQSGPAFGIEEVGRFQILNHPWLFDPRYFIHRGLLKRIDVRTLMANTISCFSMLRNTLWTPRMLRMFCSLFGISPAGTEFKRTSGLVRLGLRISVVGSTQGIGTGKSFRTKF